MPLHRLAVIILALAVLPAAAAAQAAPAAPGAPASPAPEYPGLETGKMWTFDAPPLEYWARRFSFRPTQEWLDHVRLAALRQPGCSASFVSADGLVMTNHHCARACIESATRTGEDLLENGFYARTRSEERPCRDLWVDQLLSIANVTDSINAAVPAGTAAPRAAELRAEAIAGFERRCSGGAPDLHCQVVAMYRGGQYKLYRFRRFTDVRLVFAPEAQVAFFGGDPDNFTYPRHDLDMSFYRAYVNDEPVHTEFFRWSRTGSQEGDLVFVVGNPGSTGRLLTVAQSDYLRDVQYPAQLSQLSRQIAVYRAAGEADPARAAALRNRMFSAENNHKAITGYLSGLTDPGLMARRREWEQTFRTRVTGDAALRRQYADAWTLMQDVVRQMAAAYPRQRYHAFTAWGTQLLSLAGSMVRLPSELARGEPDRQPEFRGAALAALNRAIDSTAIDTVLETRMLAAYFTAMRADLPAADPVLRAALGGRSPEDAARALVQNTRLRSGAQRRALVAGGAAAIAASADPLIVLARAIDPLEREARRQWSDITSRAAQQEERVARALLVVFGNQIAPDATFSLRISDGEIRRYPYNGTQAQPYTTLFGLYDRHYGFAGRAPWNLPARWLQRRDSLALQTPLNGVSTNDIIGGNSGSPVINREGEIVGLIFDGNIEMLPSRFLYTEARARSAWVDSRGMLETLRRVYDAGPLADELAGGR